MLYNFNNNLFYNKLIKHTVMHSSYGQSCWKKFHRTCDVHERGGMHYYVDVDSEK